jgi:hypothetical protein
VIAADFSTGDRKTNTRASKERIGRNNDQQRHQTLKKPDEKKRAFHFIVQKE